RAKTDQVVLEFLYKAAELIIQSRVNFQSEADHRRGNRRARFNLDIEEVQFVRDAMLAWREDVHLPLTIGIYLDSGGDDQRVLLEQWSVMYAPDGGDADSYSGLRRNSSSHLTGAARDVIQQLKEVCKKISVLLRALYSFMRLLPAHRLFKRSYPSTLSYEIHSMSSAFLETHFEKDVPVSRYSFVPITTPFGFLKISTVYRLNCEFIREQEAAPAPIFKNNFIIQDYVPSSPELSAQREDRMSLPTRVQEPSDFLPDADDDAERDEFHERRRRSSPANMIDETVNRRTSQAISQPMAIPQAKAPTVYEEGVASPRESGKVIHPHSYGDPDRLRDVVANPNVTAAPYGYGNVAIDRAAAPTPPSQWSATSSGGGGVTGGSGLSPASFQDEGSHFPLSTPPRHPNSLSIIRNRESDGNSVLSHFEPDDISDLLLPFAIGDGGGATSNATTLTSTGSELARPSGAESEGYGSKGVSWDTASVGSFLNQLKNAPRLHMVQDTSSARSDQQRNGDEGRAPGSSEQQPPRSVTPQAFFEDELASFRSLRDELARDL
uniref:Autophagy-related protein 13 N-terminal domain-containing protein n=1 Tax=Globisporangium ultimum (strain ATCC 200006 / CBS 805.95 / DAOM BR144) TaxID=431595 RepID=K3WW66_GLOUD